jgi:hypothetical protein
VQEVGVDDRDRARVGCHVLAEDLLGLLEDPRGRPAPGIAAEALGLRLAGDLRQRRDVLGEPGVGRELVVQAA